MNSWTEMLSNPEMIFILALLWVAFALLSFLNGIMRRLHTYQWLALSLLFGPLALLASLFLAGHGPRESLFARRKKAATRIDKRSLGDLFQGKPLYSDEIRELKRQGRFQEAVELLEILVQAAEEKAREQNRGVPHWYYEQLAVIYRRQGKAEDEKKILERYASQQHPPGAKPSKLLRRLERISEK